MASRKTPAIVITMALALLTCLTKAQKSQHIDHLAPESAPANSPAYAPLPGDVSVGDLGPSPLTYNKENCEGGRLPGQNGGYSGGGYGGGSVTPGQGGGYGGGSAGSNGWGSMTGGGTHQTAARSGSSFVAPVAFSALLLVAGLNLFLSS